MLPPPARSTLFPYTTLFRSTQPNRNRLLWTDPYVDGMKTGHTDAAGWCLIAASDRKSTRLNSSHQIISYAVFCLKKKKTQRACSRTRLRRHRCKDSNLDYSV